MAANEDVGDSWEDLEDSGELDKQLKIMKPKRDQQTNQSSGGVVIIQDESLRSMLGQEPTVKILKRPTKTTDNSQVTPDQPVRRHKTLQEREQEYAEARLRILGSAHSPMDSNSANENVSNIQNPTTNGHSYGARSSEQQGVRQDSDLNVIRVPRGPDGTKGFSRR